MGLTYSTIIDGRRYLVTDTLAGDSLSKLLMQCRIDIKNPTAYMQPYQAGAQTVWLRGINPEQYIYIDLCNARNIKGKISLYYASRDTSNPIAARWDEKFFPVDKPMKEWIIEIEGRRRRQHARPTLQFLAIRRPTRLQPNARETNSRVLHRQGRHRSNNFSPL